jgi:hypothetical protein
MRAAPCARAPRVGVKDIARSCVLITIMLALAGAAEKTLPTKSIGHLAVAFSKNLSAFAGACSLSGKTLTDLELTRHLISLVKEGGQHGIIQLLAAFTDQNQVDSLNNCGVASHKAHD